MIFSNGFRYGHLKRNTIEIFYQTYSAALFTAYWLYNISIFLMMLIMIMSPPKGMPCQKHYYYNNPMPLRHTLFLFVSPAHPIYLTPLVSYYFSCLHNAPSVSNNNYICNVLKIYDTLKAIIHDDQANKPTHEWRVVSYAPSLSSISVHAWMHVWACSRVCFVLEF